VAWVVLSKMSTLGRGSGAEYQFLYNTLAGIYGVPPSRNPFESLARKSP